MFHGKNIPSPANLDTSCVRQLGHMHQCKHAPHSLTNNSTANLVHSQSTCRLQLACVPLQLLAWIPGFSTPPSHCFPSMCGSSCTAWAITQTRTRASLSSVFTTSSSMMWSAVFMMQESWCAPKMCRCCFACGCKRPIFFLILLKSCRSAPSPKS